MKNKTILGRKPTFGDVDQIRAVKDAEKMLETILDEGYVFFDEFTEITIDCSVLFHCIVCGNSLKISHGMAVDGRETMDGIVEELVGYGVNCGECKSEYEVKSHKDRFYPNIELIKNIRDPEKINKH